MRNEHPCVVRVAAIVLAMALPDKGTGGQIIGLCYRDGTGGVVLEEVLKTEGVPYVRLHDVGGLGELGLKGLVLAEGFDSSAQEVERFLDNGGAILCLKPSGRLAEAMGLKEVGVQKDGYLVVDGKGPVVEACHGRFQLFGQTKLYQGGESLARLDPRNRHGGILRVQRGSTAAIVVAFDLPTTLLTVLQPESECGKHIDASNVEYDLGDVPQVDLLRRMLTGLLLESLDMPVLRKWYFPSQHRAMLVIVGDQDGADFKQLEVVLGLIKELKTPYTLYVTPSQQPVTGDQFEVLRKAGMEFGLHPNFFKPHGIEFDEEEFNAQLKKAEADVGCKMTGQRPHSGRWDSVRELPMWTERAGLQYDSILGPKWWETRPAKNGYWLGTGLPYHFFDPRSLRRLDVLEIAIAGSDNECFWKPGPYTVRYKPGAHRTFLGGRGFTEDEAFEVWRQFFDQALEKHPAAIGYCWHPVYLAARKLNLEHRYYRTDAHFRKCITHARSRGAGLIGANAWNDFWRAREKVSLEPVVWNPVSFTIQYKLSSDVEVNGLTLMAPLTLNGRKPRVSAGGHPRDFVETGIFGRQQAMFTVDVGRGELLVTIEYR